MPKTSQEGKIRRSEQTFGTGEDLINRRWRLGVLYDSYKSLIRPTLSGGSTSTSTSVGGLREGVSTHGPQLGNCVSWLCLR